MKPELPERQTLTIAYEDHNRTNLHLFGCAVLTKGSHAFKRLGFDSIGCCDWWTAGSGKIGCFIPVEIYRFFDTVISSYGKWRVASKSCERYEGTGYAYQALQRVRGLPELVQRTSFYACGDLRNTSAKPNLAYFSPRFLNLLST